MSKISDKAELSVNVNGEKICNALMEIFSDIPQIKPLIIIAKIFLPEIALSTGAYSKIEKVVKQNGNLTEEEKKEVKGSILKYFVSEASKEKLKLIFLKNYIDSNELDKISGIEEEIKKYKKEINDVIDKDTSLQTYYMYKKEFDDTVHDDNYVYLKAFVEPLYFHSTCCNVNICNLFVDPIIYYNNFQGDIIDGLSSGNAKFNLLVGDGGSGKSTLVSRLTYLYYILPKKCQDVFENRNLHVIRLRLLEKSRIENVGLYKSICDYMKVNPENAAFFNNKYLILDGFDELCIVNENHDYFEWLNSLLKALENVDVKVLVTSRPSMIPYNLDNGEKLYISSYSKESKNKWIDKYKKITNENIPKEVKEYMRKEDGICTTPQIMYMLAAKKGSTKYSLDNEWSIYHHVFNTELSVTEYQRLFIYQPHPSNTQCSILNQVCEEIAYKMYIDDKETYPKCDMGKILKDLNDNQNSEFHIDSNVQAAISKYCYGLCCFWKSNDDALVEFFHNNIRDYYISEKIWRRLNEIFICVNQDKEGERNSTQKAKELFLLIGRVRLSRKVLYFLKKRAVYEKESSLATFIMDNLDKVAIEGYKKTDIHAKNEEIKDVVYHCLTDFDIYSGKTDSVITNIVEVISIFYSNLFNLLISLFNANLNCCEYIDIESSLPKDFSFKAFLTFIKNLRIAQEVEFEKVYLKEFDFTNEIWDEIRFSNSYISKVNLKNVQMRNSEFKNTYFGEILLDEVNWKNTNFRYSIFKKLIVVRCSDVVLRGSNLLKADLKEAHMEESNLEEARLEEAYMEKAHLERIRLRKANLKSAHLEGAYLYGADLSGADLSGADLSDSDISGTIVEGTIFTNAKLPQYIKFQNGEMISGEEDIIAYLEENGAIVEMTDM